MLVVLLRHSRDGPRARLQRFPSGLRGTAEHEHRTPLPRPWSGLNSPGISARKVPLITRTSGARLEDGLSLVSAVVAAGLRHLPGLAAGQSGAGPVVGSTTLRHRRGAVLVCGHCDTSCWRGEVACGACVPVDDQIAGVACVGPDVQRQSAFTVLHPEQAGEAGNQRSAATMRQPLHRLLKVSRRQTSPNPASATCRARRRLLNKPATQRSSTTTVPYSAATTAVSSCRTSWRRFATLW